MTSTAQTVVRVRAHAKINLNLSVLDRRPDGYHDLRTVFQALDLHDTLTFTRREGPLALECADRRLPLDRTNLIWRAADLLWSALGKDAEPTDVVVRVEKRIPMKAGLGGGSADAAAALLGFARLWEPDTPATDLVVFGGQLGADVPFFFTGGAAMGLGRGDELYPLEDLPPLGVLLVVPSFEVSTADAYRWVDEDRAVRGAGGRASSALTGCEDLPSPSVGAELAPPREPAPPRPLAPPQARGSIPGCPWPPPACEVGNDFEPVVGARHPEVASIVGRLLEHGAQVAAMTGSGSAIFGLFDRHDTLARAGVAMRDDGFETLVTRTLTRQEYLESSAPRPATDL